MDRRSFLRRLGIGTAAAVVAPQAAVEALTPAHVPGFVPLQGGTLDVEVMTANDFSVSVEAFDGLVASGGMCAPMTPTYDFFRLAEPSRPVEESLPTIRAPRAQ